MSSRWMAPLLMMALAVAVWAQAAEEEAVRVPLKQYMEAHATGNPALIKEAFSPDARIMSVRDGQLASLSVDEFAGRFSGKPAADESQRKRRIEIVDITGTAAVAKIVLDYPAVRFVDYMSLLKVNGKWKIVNKAFNAEPKPKQ